MRRALVTGASRGIGREVARMLLADGWAVHGLSRTPPPGWKPTSGVLYNWIKCDVSQDRLPSLGYEIDAVIHCAAMRGPHGPLVENDPAAWIAAVNTNLLGTYRVVKATLPELHKSDDGRILLFSGGGAFNASPEYSAYAVAKAGVVSLMETLAEELTGTRVTCNAVAPGPIPTTIHGDDPLPDDGGEAMGIALACVRHLLSPQTTGLTGKTVSAQHDDWRSINQWNVDRLNDSPDGTRYRNPIAMLQRSALAV